MAINIIEESPCKRVIELEIPADKAESERQKAVQELRKKAPVPGFRPGRAPVVLLERYFKKAILQEVYEKLVPDALKESLAESKLQPIGDPEIIKFEYDFGQPIKISLAFEIIPEVELKEYKGLEIEYQAEELKEEMVDAEIEKIQQHLTELVPVTDRQSHKGDFIVLEVDATPADAETAVHFDSIYTEIGGKDNHAFLAAKMTKIKPDQEKEFDIKYPEEYPDKKLAGKNTHVRAKLIALKYRKVPELNDDFAKTVGNFETLDALREHLRHELQHAIEDANRHTLEQKVLGKLVEGYEFSVPAVMMESLFLERAGYSANRMIDDGIHADVVKGLDWKKIREEQNENLQQTVREMILLEKIAVKEGITVTDEDLEAEFDALAHRSNRELSEIKQQFIKNEKNLDRLKTRLRVRKTVDQLINSTVIHKPKKPKTIKKNEVDPDGK